MGRKNYELVLIEWLDAESDIGWEPPNNPSEDFLPTCESIGWVIGVEPTHIIMAADYDAVNGHYNRRIRIPIGMIRSVYALSRGDKQVDIHKKAKVAATKKKKPTPKK